MSARAGSTSGGRSCGSASQSTVPTHSATSVASSQNCGPKDLPRVENRRPIAAIAAKGKKANCRHPRAHCSAGNANARVAGTTKIAASSRPSASASQRQALRRSDLAARAARASRQATDDGGERRGDAGEEPRELRRLRPPP